MRKVMPVRRKVRSSLFPLVFLAVLPVLVPAAVLGADAGAVKSFYDLKVPSLEEARLPASREVVAAFVQKFRFDRLKQMLGK